MTHGVLIAIVVLLVLTFQIKVFVSTLHKVKHFEGLFPDEASEEWTIVRGWGGFFIVKKADYRPWQEDKKLIEAVKSEMDPSEYKKAQDKLKKEMQVLISPESKHPMSVIIGSINNYLRKNSTAVSDFSLLKDIVDRNCDALEEEIQTQIPTPLYYGLVGTMSGILLGVGFLVFSGGFKELFRPDGFEAAAAGISALLGGVALAMICSIAGILFTTISSTKHKNAKVHLERNKHDFLSWMQSELLPQLNTDMSSALTQMTRNLNEFNSTFAENSKSLKLTLSTVEDTTKSQIQLLQAVQDLKMNKMALANVKVYEQLKNCTDEIGQLSIYLSTINTYLEQVRQLSGKLDDADQRVRMIEDMAAFFKEERSQMKEIQKVIVATQSNSRDSMESFLEAFKETSTSHTNELIKHLVNQRERLEKTVEEQDKLLLHRTKELSDLVSEIKNLADVKKSMDALSKAMKEQSGKLADVISVVSKNVHVKSSDNGANVVVLSQHESRKLKYLTVGIIVVTCLFFIVIQILRLFGVVH